MVLTTILIDGFVRGTWKPEQTRRKAMFMIEPFEALVKSRPASLARPSPILITHKNGVPRVSVAKAV